MTKKYKSRQQVEYRVVENPEDIVVLATYLKSLDVPAYWVWHGGYFVGYDESDKISVILPRKEGGLLSEREGVDHQGRGGPEGVAPEEQGHAEGHIETVPLGAESKARQGEKSL